MQNKKGRLLKRKVHVLLYTTRYMSIKDISYKKEYINTLVQKRKWYKRVEKYKIELQHNKKGNTTKYGNRNKDKKGNNKVIAT